MEIEILDFIPDDKGMRVGYLDFKVHHGNSKTEIFRNVVYFEKGDKKWLDTGNVLRNGKWVKRYERNPPLKPLLDHALEAFQKTL